MSKYKLIRHRVFDFSSGSEDIQYTLHECRKTIFGKMKWLPVKAYYFDFGGGIRLPVKGDIRWARAVAKELNIKVPEVEL